MKSDREFLNDIYHKAEQMKTEEENPDRFKGIRKTPIRLVLTAATFLILLSAAFVFNNIPGAKEPATPQSISIEPRGIGIPDYVQEIIDTATEIAEVQPVEKGRETYRIHKLYKHSLTEDKITKELVNLLPVLKGETAIIFLNADSDGLQLLDIFIKKEDAKDYVNNKGDVITQERLSEIKNNN